MLAQLRTGLLVSAAALLLAGCGGEGAPPGSLGLQQPLGTPQPPPVPSTPFPTPSSAPPIVGQSCTLSQRLEWAEGEMREWYLFPELLPASIDRGRFNSVQALIDALTAEARAQGKDRFFTFATSIEQENAFLQSGATAAFGIRIQTDTPARRVLVSEAFEGAPALAAGIDRGAEILAIGLNEQSLRPVSEIIASEGAAGVTNALGPSTAGLQRTLRLLENGVQRVVTLTKAEFDILPISPRYGVQLLEDGGEPVGYVNMRTFIGSSDPALRAAFQQLRAAGVQRLIIDLRYNGGGLVRIAELLGDLLGDNRQASEIFNVETFRLSKSQFNEVRAFRRQPQSVAPLKIAFIGTRATASASELVINAMTPYLAGNSALIGANTFGKPVGQIARDRPQCDDRLRITAFASRNAAGRGDYFNGLAGEVAASCRANDDLDFQMGDPREAMTARALDFLAGRPCTPLTAAVPQGLVAARQLLVPDAPDVAQREVPGLF